MSASSTSQRYKTTPTPAPERKAERIEMMFHSFNPLSVCGLYVILAYFGHPSMSQHADPDPVEITCRIASANRVKTKRWESHLEDARLTRNIVSKTAAMGIAMSLISAYI